MEFVQELTLDLNANTTYTTIGAKQGDSARWLKIHLTKNNINYNLDSSHSFMFRMRKPDGHGVINPAFVELAQSDTYIPITITEDNFDDHVNYFELQDEVYISVSTASFFSEVQSSEPYNPSYYVFNEVTGKFIKATPDDAPPYYEFIGAGAKEIYYLQNNINFAESTINVQLTEQVLAVSGRGYADVIEYDGIGNVLSSVSFILNVMASPDVAGNATSTDEFQKLTDVVAEADDIIGEAETWTRGTNHDILVSSPSYIVDKNINEGNFNQKKKDYLYTKSNQGAYVPVSSGAAYDSTLTYYYLDASESNNAMYYMNRAHNFSDSAAAVWNKFNQVTAYAEAGESPEDVSATFTIDPSTAEASFNFILPKGETGNTGATGPTGPVTCLASDVEPTDPNVVVWIDTKGSMQPYLGTAEQIYYNAASIYGENTVGNALKGISEAEAAALDAQAAAGRAASDASAAADSATEAKNAANDAKTSVQMLDNKIVTETNDRTTADNALQNSINTKITNPNTQATGILMATANDNVISYSWGQENYDNLINRPYINGIVVSGGLSHNLSLLTNASNVIKVNHLDSDLTASYNKSNSAVQAVQLNNELLFSTDYIAPYVLDSEVTESNWDEVKSSLYYYNADQSKYIKVTVDQAYSSNDVYYTHDASYDYQKFIDLGTVLKEDNITKENLLDNSWFQINQHNFTSASISSAGEYLCDRWKVMVCQDQTRTISWSSGGLSISTANGTDPLKDFAIGQILEEKLSQNLKNKTVCLTVGYIGDSGTIQYGSGFSICTEAGTPFIQLGKGLGWFVRLIKENNNLAFQIAQAQNITGEQLSDSAITIKNVKLEIGKFSTLAQDIAPIPTDELAKCQKYFYKCEGQAYSESGSPTIIGHGIAALAGQLDWTFDLPSVITSSSAVIATSTSLLVKKGITSTTNQGYLSSENIAGSTRYPGINGFYLKTTTASLTSGAAYFVLLPNAVSAEASKEYITISAEL